MSGMDRDQWARWMDLLGREAGENGPGLRPPPTVPAYVFKEDTEWSEAERLRRVAEIRRALREHPPENGHWVILERANGDVREILWPADQSSPPSQTGEPPCTSS